MDIHLKPIVNFFGIQNHWPSAWLRRIQRFSFALPFRNPATARATNNGIVPRGSLALSGAPNWFGCGVRLTATAAASLSDGRERALPMPNNEQEPRKLFLSARMSNVTTIARQ